MRPVPSLGRGAGAMGCSGSSLKGPGAGWAVLVPAATLGCSMLSKRSLAGPGEAELVPPPSARPLHRLKVGLARLQAPAWRLLPSRRPATASRGSWLLLGLCHGDVGGKGEFLLPAPLPWARPVLCFLPARGCWAEVVVNAVVVPCCCSQRVTGSCGRGEASLLSLQGLNCSVGQWLAEPCLVLACCGGGGLGTPGLSCSCQGLGPDAVPGLSWSAAASLASCRGRHRLMGRCPWRGSNGLCRHSPIWGQLLPALTPPPSLQSTAASSRRSTT